MIFAQSSMACLFLGLQHLTCCTSAPSSEGFLGGTGKSQLQAASQHDKLLTDVLAMVMGCGADGTEGFTQKAAIEKVLNPLWKVLPKNRRGRVEWRMLRRIAHRYFMKQSSLLIRGFEPTREVNDSHLGAAEILKKKAPSLLEAIIQGKHQTEGFVLDDAVSMIAALEQLIFDSQATMLTKAYRQMGKLPSQTIEESELSEVIGTYMIYWLMDDEDLGIKTLLRNQTLLTDVIPQWPEIREYVTGMIKTLKFARQTERKSGHGRLVMTGLYSFDDAHHGVAKITKTFAAYWENQCQELKSSLVSLDKTATGRVKLSDFYGANTEGEWRFGESESYLRELGALDESSLWRGKQVIIPNYLQGASNCIITTEHYLVCCVNECEAVLNEIEAFVGAPAAQPSAILDMIGNITDLEDQGPQLDTSLREQLFRLADIHGGQVQLHGRLFSQWLHYVFPRECPFPHKSGTASLATLTDFGEQSYASVGEIRTHAAARNVSRAALESVEEEQWMSQWTDEEELMMEASDLADMTAPWERHSTLAVGGVFYSLVLIGIFLNSLDGRKPSGGGQHTGGAVATQRTHFV